MTPGPASPADNQNGEKAPEAEQALREDFSAVPETGLLGRLIAKAGTVFAFCFLISMVILLMEVILRYVFHSPTLWAHETTSFLTSVGFLFGGLYCIARDKHIRVVLIYDSLSHKMRRYFNIVISLINCLAAGIFAWASWQMVKRAAFAPDGSVRFEASGSAWNPPFPAFTKIFLLIILILMTVQFLILAWKYAVKRPDNNV